MRKIKLQIQISLDGYIAGPNGEMDWMVWNWDEALKNYATELTNSADTFLLGRKTGEGMAVYWPTVASNPESKEEDLWIADKLNTLPKVVFSKTVSSIDWTNVTIASDVAKEVAHLKQQPGKDMILYGGAGIVSSFIEQNLIDEYHLFVNPVIIGSGKTIFNNQANRLQLKLIRTIPSSTGIVILCYQPDEKAF
jgi:dihydrofolate reductase